ncbi:hypothetical protein HAX54_036240 [Datura stramonium]|uniref:Glycosyltransferase N-terminal domain-containing protein n=1 Tax=Datura stramonium TaxID=4076 RepID=A0ABS8VGK6_DATST|nr:hypothetical protein [Datura stramonium]
MAKLLRILSSKAQRIVIIHDSLMGSVVQDFVYLPNAEAYAFHSVSAFTLFLFMWENMGRPFDIDANFLKDVPSLEDCFSPEFEKFIKIQYDYMKFNSGRIYNTCRVIEDEQIKEIAIGLERSGQKFIWVLRDADKGNIFAKDQLRKIELPKGFEERVKGKGILLRDWAPQLEILAHSSVGGFMSHCGWNSCMESISMGVPIAAWPMHSDQPRNTVLVTKILKVGIIVKDWTRRHEVVTRGMVQAAVEKLIVSKEGEEMRNRAMDLSASLKKSVTESGIKNMELDSFISHITRQI